MKKLIIILTCALAFTTTTSANVQTDLRTNDEKPIKAFQLSILPFIGTDGTDVINYRYRFSLNLFAGINGGVEGIEAGYFMNINRGNVKGFQGAGFANLVIGHVEGFQGAGFGNVVRGNASGFQGAGFMNVMHGNASGVRGAGFMNVIRGNNSGLMGSGFMNVIGGDAQGIAGAGFGNFYRGDFAGISVAGFMNTIGGSQADGLHLAGFANAYNGVARGLMVAGFGNFAKERVQGTQLAGFMNTAGDLQGLQVSGFLNVARKVEGIQLGFINVSDTISGVPIGFLSVTRKGGLRQFELAVSDALITSLSFKIGVPVFYNIFSIGHLPLHDEIKWATGYGIGSNLEMSEANRMQLELHSYQLHRRDKWWESAYNHHLNELRVLFSHRTNTNIEWFAGPVIYNQVFRDHDALFEFDDMSVAPYTIFKNERKDYVSQWWAGLRGGVRWVIR